MSLLTDTAQIQRCHQNFIGIFSSLFNHMPAWRHEFAFTNQMQAAVFNALTIAGGHITQIIRGAGDQVMIPDILVKVAPCRRDQQALRSLEGKNAAEFTDANIIADNRGERAVLCLVYRRIIPARKIESLAGKQVAFGVYAENLALGADKSNSIIDNTGNRSLFHKTYLQIYAVFFGHMAKLLHGRPV